MTNRKPELGKHAYAGALAPWNDPPVHHDWDTFSVACFLWIPGRYGPKQGPAKVRVKGPTSHPHLVAAKAREVCAQLDSGSYYGPKNITVRAPE